MNSLFYAHNVSALSSKLMLISTLKFNEVEGFSDEFIGDYRDIDFSLKLLEKGYVNVINPYAEVSCYNNYSNRQFWKSQDKKLQLKWDK